MNNIPEIKLGIVAVSRDCFPIALSEKRRKAIVTAYGEGIYECPVTVENELDMLKAVEDVKKAECNALVVFLGNFGPETPETLIAKNFDGPCMFVSAAEGDGDMINGRHRFSFRSRGDCDFAKRNLEKRRRRLLCLAVVVCFFIF